MRCIQCHTEILVLVDETCDEFASETAFVLLGDHVPQIPLFSQTAIGETVSWAVILCV